MSDSSNPGLLVDTSDWSVIGIRFSLHTVKARAAIPRRGPQPAAHQTITMNIHPNGSQAVGVLSVTTDDSGVLRQATSWRAGSESIRIFNSETCLIESMDLPVEAEILEIIEDAIGPLRDPREVGYEEITPGVFQRDEGPDAERVTNWNDLDARVIEAVGHDDGRPRTRIDGISISETAFDLQAFTFPEECSNDVETADVREMLMDR